MIKSQPIWNILILHIFMVMQFELKYFMCHAAVITHAYELTLHF